MVRLRRETRETARSPLAPSTSIPAESWLDNSTDLRLPERYTVLHSAFLAPAWKRFRFGLTGLEYWADVLINIAGFVPLGFSLLSSLSLRWSSKGLFACVIVAGSATSLLIECLQYLLPTRDSGMTDLFTNSIGVVVGAALYRSSCVNRIWRQMEERLTAIGTSAIRFLTHRELQTQTESL